jgi:phosphonate transport system ATP-binding protein
VLVSLHQVEHAFNFCPRTIALRAGEVVYDGPTRLLSADRLQDLYGTQTDELYAPPAPDTVPHPHPLGAPALHAA